MRRKQKFILALFYCQNTPGSSEKDRQFLERQYGWSLRLFPLPCSGRMEPIHFMRALEEFADAAYLVACPEGTCRYHEGNTRARKRVTRTAEILAEIGMEKDRVGIVLRGKDDPRSLKDLVGEIMKKVAPLGPSPVFNPDLRRNAQKARRKTRAAVSRRSRQAGEMQSVEMV